MTLHRDIALGEIHILYNWSYADNAALMAATGFVSSDVGKVAYQQDDHSLWLLSDDSPIVWEQLTGPGVGGAVASVNGQTGAVTLDADDIADTATNVFASPAELTKLGGIEALADVTDAANVDAAGAVMNSDTSTAAMSFVIDEDSMASNSATKVSTQQSVKAYVDAAVAGGGLTQEQIEDFIGTTLLVAGTGATVTYNDGAGTITIAATSGLTQEQIEDFLGTTTIVAGTGITITYSDVANTITVAVTASTYQPLAANLTDLGGLADPNADRIPFWDDSAGHIVWLTVGTGLAITGTSIDGSSAYTTENAQDDIAALIAAGTHVGITATYSDAGNSLSLKNTAIFTVPIGIGDGINVITPGHTIWWEQYFDATILGWSLTTYPAGTLQLDIRKTTYSNWNAFVSHPVSGDSICASAKPAVSGASAASDTTLTGWVKTMAQHDMFQIEVDASPAPATCLRAVLSLHCQRT